jgi:hypothetical protein
MRRRRPWMEEAEQIQDELKTRAQIMSQMSSSAQHT